MKCWLPALLVVALPAPAAAMRKHLGATAFARRTKIQGYIFGDGHGGVNHETAMALDGDSGDPLHVVLETPKPGAGGLRAKMQNTSLGSFLRPRVIFVSFDDNSGIERSAHGVPVLRSMFDNAILEFPEADTYTYFNSDIAVDSSFIETADAVAKAAKQQVLKKRFLVVGRRTNVNWTAPEESVKSYAVSDALVEQELPKGELFTPDAEDYFMVSAESFKWSAIPAFIVGHRGFDNWLVSKAATDPDMDAIDATQTLNAMHMTDAHVGNKEGFTTSPDGKNYNMNLIQKGDFNWRCAMSTSVEWETQKSADGQIVFAKRKDNKCKHLADRI